MLLSIIIPSFKQPEELRLALDSIKSQCFESCEIVIMDGAQDELTASLATEYKELNIRYYAEKDEGVYDAMNKAIARASGEWLFFMGCDDLLYDATVLADVSKFLTDEWDMVYGNVVLKSNKQLYDGESSLEKLLNVGNICHQAIFYKKEVFAKLGGYHLRYKIWADWDFNLRCFKHPAVRITYIDRVVALYNDTSGISSSPDAELSKELPVFYVNRINGLQTELAMLKQENDLIKSSLLFKARSRLGRIARKLGYS